MNIIKRVYFWLTNDRYHRAVREGVHTEHFIKHIKPLLIFAFGEQRVDDKAKELKKRVRHA